MSTPNPGSDLGVGLKQSPSEPTEDVKNFDEDALVDKISGGFAAVFGDGDDPDYDDPDASDAGDDQDDYQFQTELDDDDDQQDDEDGGSAADDEHDDVDDASNSDDYQVDSSDAPTIPPAHERSLLANHTREEIQTLHKNLGAEEFANYAARAHEKRNAETARMAELGRMAQQFGPNPLHEQQAAAPRQEAHQPTQQQQAAPAKIEPVSVEALRDKFGDDELIDTFATQMNAQAAVLNQMMAQQQQSQQQLVQQEQQALARRIDEFFDSKELAPFADHYGANGAALTEAQKEARVKVLEMADALSAGAQFQGRSVSIDDALSRAHSALSVDVSEASVRSKIKKQAKRRQRGISVRPNSKRGSKPDLSRKGAPKDEKALEARTRSRMKAVFG